jgi:hypothetical protein
MRAGDGYQLGRRVRPVLADHLPRWQAPQERGSGYSREGCGSLADAARDLHVLLADPRRTIEKGLVAGEVNDELGAGV